VEQWKYASRMSDEMLDFVRDGVTEDERGATYAVSAHRPGDGSSLSLRERYVWLTLVYGTHQGVDEFGIYCPHQAISAVEVMIAACGIEPPYVVAEMPAIPTAEQLS
jgi:hypothetical protein